MRLRVASWNVLAQSLLREHRYLYHACDPRALHEHSRVARLVERLQRMQAQVLALQEVEQQLFTEALEPHLARIGYRGVFKKRTADQTDGVAIFFQTATLKLVHAEALEHRVLAEGISDRSEAEKMRKHNASLILVLHDRAEPQHRLIVSCCHILWNPKRGLVKLKQILHLLERWA